jgi:hypothetical protein
MDDVKKYAENYAHNYFDMHETNNYKALLDGFLAGANWQAERMYSDKDLRNCWDAAIAYIIGSNKYLQQTHPDFNQWFENNKKK